MRNFSVKLNLSIQALAGSAVALTTTLVAAAGCAWVGASGYERPITEQHLAGAGGQNDLLNTPIDDSTGQFTNAVPGSDAYAGPGVSPWVTLFTPGSEPVQPFAKPRLALNAGADRPETNRPAISVVSASDPTSTTARPTPEPAFVAVNTRANKVAPAQPEISTSRTARSPESTPPLNLSQVTYATEGADFDPCVSRDGMSVVYASTQHRDTADIYVKPTDGRVITQLTNDPANDVMPAISPDGQHIAFASDRTGNWDIYVMPITGGRAVQVTSDATDELHPSWSPDGKSLVFCRAGAMSGRWEMWVIDAANQAASNFIGYGLFPSWCPVSGSGATLGAGATDKVLFQLGRERGERSFAVWTVDYKDGRTGNATEIASSGEAAFINPGWSPDGSKIVYVSVPNASEGNGQARQQRPASAELWMLNTDGSGRVNLTGSTAIALMPFWGPKERLYFVANRGTADNIWSIDLEPAIRAASLNGSAGMSRTAAKGGKAMMAEEPAEAAEKEVANVPEGK